MKLKANLIIEIEIDIDDTEDRIVATHRAESVARKFLEAVDDRVYANGLDCDYQICDIHSSVGSIE